jgi:hypothetical protein
MLLNQLRSKNHRRHMFDVVQQTNHDVATTRNHVQKRRLSLGQRAPPRAPYAYQRDGHIPKPFGKNVRTRSLHVLY